MSNSHTHSHAHHHHHHSGENIATAFFLNLGFTIIEAVGGFLTNSVAIISDAIHDLGDSFSLGLAWYFDKVSKRKPNTEYTYGYKRFALLGALINCLILLGGSVWVIYESITRITNPETVSATGMLWLAILGVIVNGLAAFKTGHGEGHGVNERVVSLHMLEDVLGWVAVLIVSIVMIFVNVPILDPILSICIAAFILINVYRNLKESVHVIMQGVPDTIDIEEVKKTVEDMNNVMEVHDLHLWSLDSEYTIASMHVVVDTWEQQILCELKKSIKTKLATMNIEHATIEFELTCEHCQKCELCQQ